MCATQLRSWDYFYSTMSFWPQWSISNPYHIIIFRGAYHVSETTDCLKYPISANGGTLKIILIAISTDYELDYEVIHNDKARFKNKFLTTPHSWYWLYIIRHEIWYIHPHGNLIFLFSLISFIRYLSYQQGGQHLMTWFHVYRSC